MRGFIRKTTGGPSKGGKRFGSGFGNKRTFGGSGGGFGGGSRGGFRGNSDGPQLHDAVCAECGEETQVPFKPNGRKPVLCRDCFRGEDGGRNDSFGAKDTRRPSFDKRRSFDAKPSDNGGVERQLVELNSKLDRIVTVLEGMAKDRL